MGSKIFNHLPIRIKNLANEKKVFKKTLQRFLIENVFYSVDEFLNFNVNNFDNVFRLSPCTECSKLSLG